MSDRSMIAAVTLRKGRQMIRLQNKNARWLFDQQYYFYQLAPYDKKIKLFYNHYAKFGWRQGKNPHPLFDVSWYLATYSDVAAAGIDPAAHYVSHGQQEGRQPHPLFDPVFYLQYNKDVARSESIR